MTRTYSTIKCYVCGKEHSMNGLARVNHLRKHVREGILEETRVEGYENAWCGFKLIDPAKRDELYPRRGKKCATSVGMQW
jgi:hypothetical protein